MFQPRGFVFIEAWTKSGIHVFGITPGDYEDLSTNMAAIQTALEQYIAQVDYYRNCIKRHKEELNANP